MVESNYVRLVCSLVSESRSTIDETIELLSAGGDTVCAESYFMPIQRALTELEASLQSSISVLKCRELRINSNSVA